MISHLVLEVYVVMSLQIKRELHGKPLKEASDDRTLPLCWKGRKPFKSLHDVKKYFKSIALIFAHDGNAKTQFELPPEDYLLISVIPS